ncbi:MAG: hypothetical protein KGD58_17355 [Candidatus Lokiarchaeota archaeon]|nr:hypothetical protein [Candidatus Lokiarchaeota archaeon]
MVLPTSWTFWLEGLTASSVISVGIILGLISILKARKLKAKLLTVLGLSIFFIGFLYLGPASDFLMVIITGSNLYSEIWGLGIYGILSYLWIAPALVLAMYIGGELLIPKRKWILVIFYLVLGIIFEYFLWFHTSETFVIPPPPSGEIIDSSFVTLYPTFLLMALFILSILIFHGMGFLIKAMKSTGVLRKKFLLLGFGFIIFAFAGAGDALVDPGILLVIVRLAMITSIILMYLGLKA